MDIRDNLREFIKDKGYSQTKLAAKSNLSGVQLSQILLKKRKLDANELFDLCHAIEITPSELRNYTHINN